MALAMAATALSPVATDAQAPPPETAPRLVRSLSGPSATLSGPKIEFDEIRHEFVYPQDQTVTVYFEWLTNPGLHVLSASWRQPDGQVALVSPDMRIRSADGDLRVSWVFQIVPWLSRGTWNVDVRINGQPAGSHTFRVAGVDGPSVRFTADDIFRTYLPSVVRVHRLNASDARADSGSGFVIGPNAIATAFQMIDGAHALEVEFADGRRVRTNEVIALSREQDWAVVRGDTATTEPIPFADADPVKVGARLSFFDIESDARVLVAVDVGAVSTAAPYGARLQFLSQATADAIGGPVIDEGGRAVGIVGASATPGHRIDLQAVRVAPWLGRQAGGSAFATAMSNVAVDFNTPGRSLESLRAAGTFTPAVQPTAELVGAGTTKALPADVTSLTVRNDSEFSSSSVDPIVVYTFWSRSERSRAGDISIDMVDVHNRSVASVAPTRVNLMDRVQRVSFTMSPKGVPNGYYRVDVLWNGTPIWRTSIRIVD